MAAVPAARANTSSMSSDHRAAGAARMTPPQPLELLMWSLVVPKWPSYRALRHVVPGARWEYMPGSSSSHPSGLTAGPPWVCSQRA